MPRTKLRSLVAYAFLLTLACDRHEIRDRRDGPTVVLTPDATAVEHIVTLCMEGPEIHGIGSSAHIFVVVRMFDAAPKSKVSGLVATGTRTEPFDLTADHTTHQLSLQLDARGAWGGQAGRRCADPQTIRFAYSSPDPTAKVELEWTAHFSAHMSPTPACDGGSEIHTQQVSISLQPAPPK